MKLTIVYTDGAESIFNGVKHLCWQENYVSFTCENHNYVIPFANVILFESGAASEETT